MSDSRSVTVSKGSVPAGASSATMTTLRRPILCIRAVNNGTAARTLSSIIDGNGFDLLGNASASSLATDASEQIELDEIGGVACTTAEATITLDGLTATDSFDVVVVYGAL